MSEMIICPHCEAENAINRTYCRSCNRLLRGKRPQPLKESERADDHLQMVNPPIPEEDVQVPPRVDTTGEQKKADNLLTASTPPILSPDTQLPPSTSEDQRNIAPPRIQPDILLFGRLKNLGQESVRAHKKVWLTIIVLLIIIIIALPILSLYHFPAYHGSSQSATPTPVPLKVFSNGIGVTSVKGESIGISDGSYALDTSRAGGSLKMDASASLRAGNIGTAITQWSNVLSVDSNDAESQIYRQDQLVLASGNPYITIVVGVQLSANDAYSHDILQGAYVAQEEINDAQPSANKVKIRLLIAKSGSDASRSTDIARQIVQAAQADRSIVGVLGWPTTTTTINALSTLAHAHVPVISASAAGNILASSYFFRTTATSDDQVRLLSNYVKNRLNPRSLVVFVDHSEPYSDGIAKSFEQDYQDNKHPIVPEQFFHTYGKPADFSNSVQDVLKKYNPDVIFFTSISVDDAKAFLKAIPENNPLKVIMGGVGYTLTEAEANNKNVGYTRIRFAATAFPDAWRALGKANPLFITEYQKDFDPQQKHKGAYTYGRPTSYVMLAYDAMFAFQKANQVFPKGKQPTPDEMRQALSQINGAQAMQGITGVISFDGQGNATKKAVFILRVDDNAHLQADAYQGCYFLNTQCSDNITYLT